MRKTIILFSVLFFLFLCSCKNYVTSLTDIDIYINEDYANENVFVDNTWITDAGKNAKKVFPKYEEISYNYDKIEFYLFSDNMKEIDTTFVLELVFDNTKDYEDAKKDVYSTYTFLKEKERDGIHILMPSSEMNIGNYFVKIAVTDVDDYPKSFLAICINDESNIIRYLYCYDTDTDGFSSTNRLIRAIKSSTACQW